MCGVEKIVQKLKGSKVQGWLGNIIVTIWADLCVCPNGIEEQKEIDNGDHI